MLDLKFGISLKLGDGCLEHWFFPEDWLSDMDSNHDKCLQRALCYHYTIGQRAPKIDSRAAQRKGNFQVNPVRK